MIPKNPKWPEGSSIIEAIEARQNNLDNPGFCLSCGELADNCEPDARDHSCESCGEPCVFGAEEIMFMNGLPASEGTIEAAGKQYPCKVCGKYQCGGACSAHELYKFLKGL